MKLRTEMRRLVTMTAPMGNDDELFHDAACAHALMQAMDEYYEAGQTWDFHWITIRASELMREWGFDSGEQAE